MDSLEDHDAQQAAAPLTAPTRAGEPETVPSLLESMPLETRLLEVELAITGDVDALSDELEALPSPRLLATHLPYSLLPERMTETCRVVCVCRDPKDALVSSWLFTRKAATRRRSRSLAEFMGCEFSVVEEEQGVVDAIVELCSLDTMKNMEVNRNGRGDKLPVEKESFFRELLGTGAIT
ncbi:hypothetical protein EJB05_32470, partial [Eragrostis curvula]